MSQAASPTSELQQLGEKIAPMPRSERVTHLFDHREWGADGGPTDYQADLLDYAADRAVAEAAVKPGRQTGKTMTGALIAADAAYNYPGADILITAPFQETADEMFRETKQYFKQGPLTLAEYGVTNDNKQTWEFSTGTRILSRTLGDVGAENPGQRGKNPRVVIVDEAHYAKDRVFTEVIEEFFITHDSYEYYLFSTPRGKQGYFYEKVAQDDRWYSPHWPTEISPFANQEFIERKRRELDSKTFAQEFEGEFVDTGEALIPFELYDANRSQDAPELADAVYLGVDIARKGRDRTVYIEMDDHGAVNVVAAEEQSRTPGVIGRIKRLHAEREYAAILVDETAVGGGVADDEGLRDIPAFTPVTFSTKTKHELYTNLLQAFEQETLTLPPHRRLMDETTALSFDYTQNGYLKVSHPSGGHDDFPDALALANHGRVGTGRKTVRRKGYSGPAKGSMT